MSAVYDDYIRNITRTSPFIWAHRLEIPLALGAVATVISLAAGLMIGSVLSTRKSAWPEASAEDVITTIFLIMTFFCGLATLLWLIVLSRTLDLRYSLKASKYPIYTVLVMGAAIINAPPFVFGNVADMYASHRNGVALLMPSLGNEPWGTTGLMFFLSFISIAVLFGLLMRRCSFHIPFASFFICIFALMIFALYSGAVVKSPRAIVGLWIIAWIGLAIGGVAMYLGKLRKYQDAIFGVMLFSFSPAAIYLFYAVATANDLFPVLAITEKRDALSVTTDTALWGVALLLCVGLILNEITFSVMRKARRYAS